MNGQNTVKRSFSMKIIVTGGCGFIGSHITDALLAEGHEVLAVDDLSSGRLKNIDKRAAFAEADIRSEALSDIFAAFRPEVVYHEAAQTKVQKSVESPGLDADINITGTINVLERCRENGVRKLIYASSAAVYGEPRYLPIDELHPVEPLSFYGLSKLVGERYITMYAALFGLKYTIFRYANVYGERQPSMSDGAVIPIFIERMAQGKPPVIFGDGGQTRDFIYVGDVAAANLAALERADNEIINIGTGSRISINALVGSLIKIFGMESAAEYGPPRIGDIRHSYFNTAKMTETLGIEPKTAFEAGLARIIGR
jgi:UDP-glucose 4-epimerase